MAWLSKILKKFFGPKTEIEYVEAALKRYENELWDIQQDFDPTKDCCSGCASGGRESFLINKIARVEHRFETLRKRKKKYV